MSRCCGVGFSKLGSIDRHSSAASSCGRVKLRSLTHCPTCMSCTILFYFRVVYMYIKLYAKSQPLRFHRECCRGSGKLITHQSGLIGSISSSVRSPHLADCSTCVSCTILFHFRIECTYIKLYAQPQLLRFHRECCRWVVSR